MKLTRCILVVWYRNCIVLGVRVKAMICLKNRYNVQT